MIGRFEVSTKDISALDRLGELSAEIKPKAAAAINRAADRARTESARQMRLQLNFQASYLAPAARRLFVSRKASASSLEARITARFRATSLARFTDPGVAKRGKGVRVSVKPNGPRQMDRAFLLNLRAGADDIETRSNLGLALRLKRGERIQNKRVVPFSKKDKTLFLLYGPSVAQAFATVAEDVRPGTEAFIEREFFRLLEVDL